MKTRAFIAVNLPATIKKELDNQINKIKNALNGDIKWVRPENFHLTLHFLGYLDEKKIIAIQRILDEEIKNANVFSLEIEELGAFPNKSRPRVLFIKCRQTDGNSLMNLQKSIGEELEKIGIKTDDRPWQTHITFARFRIPVQTSLAEFQTANKLKFQVDSVDLMKSELRREGPIYTIIKKFFL